MPAKWVFTQYQRGDTLRNPVAGAFFSQEAITDPAEALVRESIQNSLDARIPGSKVVVRIGVATMSSHGQQELMALLGGLKPHLDAEGNGLENAPDFATACRFALIEDFGTRGLEGDPKVHLPENDTRNDFFSFFRAEGYTSKGGVERGRWGVGKTVFPRSSEINTFFGFTVRASDQRALLMGRCILKGHKIADIAYHPDGYFGEEDDRLVLPVENPVLLGQVRRLFGLRRTHEPGLSVVVPFLQDEIDFRALVAAVLRGYYFTILTDDLEVEISDNGRHISISKDTIYEQAAEYSDAIGNDLHPLIDLARWGVGLSDDARIPIPEPDPHYAPSWERVEISDEVIAQVRDAMRTGEAIALRVGLGIKRKEGPRELSWFDIYLRADVTAQGLPVFIREGLIVTNAGGRRARGTQAIVNIEQGAAATFLGDAENVAHTEWNKDRSGFKSKYENAPTTLKFVQESVAAILKRVTEGQEDQDPDLLKDIFFFDVPRDQDLDDGGKVPGGAGARRVPRVPSIQRSAPRYRVDKVEGGFAISSGEDGSRVPDKLRVRMAYDTSVGNPLTEYNHADFEAGDLHIVPKKGLTLEKAAANTLVLKINDPSFYVSVTGFDKHRDVFISVDAIDALEDQNDRQAN